MSNPKLWKANFDDSKYNQADSHHFSWGSLYEASIGERLGWQECETYGGRGFWSEWHQTNEANGGHQTNEASGKQTYHDCPDCVDGWTPPAELVERLKSVIGETFIREMGWGESKPFAALEVYAIAEKQAKQALLEQARWIGEQDES